MDKCVNCTKFSTCKIKISSSSCGYVYLRTRRYSGRRTKKDMYLDLFGNEVEYDE